MPEITTIKPHPLKGRPSPVKGRLYLDKHAPRLITEGNSAGKEPDDLLTTKQVAAWLQVSTEWLEIRRSQGNQSTEGPPYLRLSGGPIGRGRVVYRRADVLAWLETRRHRSTVEYRQQPVAQRQPVLITADGRLKRFAPLPPAKRLAGEIQQKEPRR